MLHTLWSKAVDQPGYVKEEWLELEAELFRKEEKIRHLEAAVGRANALASLIVEIREEQVSDAMGFGATKADKMRNSQVYAAAIARSASKIDAAIDSFVIAVQVTGEKT